MQNASGSSFLADCPTRLATEIIADHGEQIVDFANTAAAYDTRRERPVAAGGGPFIGPAPPDRRPRTS